MLIHGYTGAIDIATDNVVNFLKDHVTFSQEEFPLSEKTLEMLEQRGYVTDKTAAEERQHVRRWAELFHKYNKAFSPGFMFLVSYDCNFRCPYCYEGGISGDGRHWTQQRFSKELVDKAYQAMEQIEPRKERQGHVITLYGGEPLMKENKEIVNYILEQGKKNGFYFNAITNGYDLECYEEWLGPDMINFLQITLDGDQKMHDSRRFHHQTGHSFEKIYRNIKMALDKDIRVSIRFNADANNLRYVKILEEMFRKSGYTDYKKSVLFPLFDAQIPRCLLH